MLLLAPGRRLSCETCPEAEPVGTAKRQSCQEMKSELPRLGLQKLLSFLINNSGSPRGWEGDIISHPVPIITLCFPPLSHYFSAPEASCSRRVGDPLAHVQPGAWSSSAIQRRKKPGHRFLSSIFSSVSLIIP